MKYKVDFLYFVADDESVVGCAWTWTCSIFAGTSFLALLAAGGL